MAKLDFKEIPPADKASGRQDAFELFARDALEVIGFTILLAPSRGADGGKDLIVEEHRVGPLSDTRFKWLVSCKHLAHSGSSVKPDLERNVTERVKSAGCHGFLGFYSTLPSTGLRSLIGSLPDIDVKLLDHEEIERRLLETSKGRHLIQRFFPASYDKLKPEPARLYTQERLICCENCGKDLFDPPSGVWVLWHTDSEEGKDADHFVDMHFACKGTCDRKVERQVRMRHSAKGFIYDGWDDIPDMAGAYRFHQESYGFHQRLRPRGNLRARRLRQSEAASAGGLSACLTKSDTGRTADVKASSTHSFLSWRYGLRWLTLLRRLNTPLGIWNDKCAWLREYGQCKSGALLPEVRITIAAAGLLPRTQLCPGVSI